MIKPKALDIVGLVALFLSLIMVSYAGIIWAIALGFAFGSYATSIISRAPKGILLKQKDPYCMSCNKYLAAKDLFPIFSYVSTNGKCRYCGAKIPTSIFITELLVILCFIISYITLGFGLMYFATAIVFSLLCTLLVLGFIAS